MPRPNPCNAIELHRRLSKWCEQRLITNILLVVIDEPEFVGEQIRRPGSDTPARLVEDFGIDDDTTYHPAPNTATPVELIQHVLNARPSWGEFYGGVVGSMYLWPAEIQVQLIGYITVATMKIQELGGVDH